MRNDFMDIYLGAKCEYCKTKQLIIKWQQHLELAKEARLASIPYSLADCPVFGGNYMKSQQKQKPKKFLDSTQELFTEIQSWATAKGLCVKRGSVTLNEHAYGSYQAETLQILTDGDEKVAELVPVGASIIGAKGRIDFVGTVDSVILADWDKGGPSVTTTIEDGSVKKSRTQPLYRDVEEAGWYWVESRKLSRAHKFDERLFYELLRGVSDYDCRS
jgi:hypothetical protein